MNEERKVEIKIEGAGLKFEGQVSFVHAIEMLRVATISEKMIAEKPSEKRAEPSGGKIADFALSELIHLTDPATSAETIAIIATWICDTENLDTLTRMEIRERYKEARLPEPGNYARDFNTSISKGFLAQARGEKDRFYVTRTGRKLAEISGDV